ncbi:MAG: T9SS type A sorting domain-containing protein [Ignavibacteria bacterium]|nr:T9SS type A sorting domain-containing protein [Ignavibacteria bacterium]
MLALNYQNFAIVGYVLKELGPPSGGGSVTITRTQTKVIPENGGNANPAVDTIDISGIGGNVEITKVTLTLDEVQHSWIGDLRFWLTKGSIVDTCISRIGWTGTGFGNSCDDFIGTILSDSAGLVNIQNIPTTCIGTQSQATGNFNPKEPFSIYQNNNTNPNGSYILRIADNAAGDTGSLRSWTLKIDYDVITGVNNNVTSIPNEFSLSQNYPNPFNPSTKIAYTIPNNGLVTLKIYNLLGKEVASLINEVKSAGTYEVNFNGANLSSGVYFYRLESGNFVDTKKMFLLK